MITKTVRVSICYKLGFLVKISPGELIYSTTFHSEEMEESHFFSCRLEDLGIICLTESCIPGKELSQTNSNKVFKGKLCYV